MESHALDSVLSSQDHQEAEEEEEEMEEEDEKVSVFTCCSGLLCSHIAVWVRCSLVSCLSSFTGAHVMEAQSPTGLMSFTQNCSMVTVMVRTVFHRDHCLSLTLVSWSE